MIVAEGGTAAADVLKDLQPDQSELLAISNEMAVVCDLEGSVRWADARAEHILGVRTGVSFVGLVADGAQDKARRLLETARNERTDMWELVLQLGAGPVLTAWRGAPTDGGALLVGSLLPRYYDELQARMNAVIGDLAALQRETESQRRQLADTHLRNKSLLEAERAAHIVVEDERRRLQQVLDSLPEGIVILDRQGRYTVANAAANDMMGIELTGQTVASTSDTAYGARDMDGKPIPSRMLPGHRSVLDGDVVRGEQLVVRNAKTGRDVPLLVNSVPLYESDGNLAGAVTVFQDISAIKELELEKDHFLATVSHDLKNPLAGIKGWIQILSRRTRGLPEDQRERWQRDLGTVETAANRLGAIIEELTDLTHLQMGRQLELHTTHVDLVELAGRVLAEHRQVAHKHALRLQSGDGSLVGDWDATRIGRVVGNLISNAVKYSPDGGDIQVAVAREAVDGVGWAVLSVQDSGIGIAEQDLPRVFDRFFRGRNAAKRFAGTGVGLAGARQLVEQHGGTIEVRSQEGAGSTFTVRLPLAHTPDA